MFMAYYCNIGDGINDEQQTDGILQTLLSQMKDHKGNLASITTGIYLCIAIYIVGYVAKFAKRSHTTHQMHI